jgi:hypothetical protein
MAVLLRHAARRLVGVQRTQLAAAAVAEKQRSLLPRLVHTDEVYLPLISVIFGLFCPIDPQARLILN